MRRVIQIDQGTTAAARLTWISGTKLPYESLLHVVHRLILLNPILGQVRFAQMLGRQTPIIGSLLTNERNTWSGITALPIRDLAVMLGEADLRFDFSHIGCFKGWAKELFCRDVVICPTCASLGFHTVLFSLTSLKTCPIHTAEALTDHCRCGRQFPGLIDSDLFRSPGKCMCGEPYFFPDTRLAYQPLIHRRELKAFDDIVAWLQSIGEPIMTW